MKFGIYKSDGSELPTWIGSGLPDASVIAGFILSIVLWIVVSVITAFIFYVLGNIVAILFVLIAAVLYWIFFRALRLVLKKSLICRGNLSLSIGYSFLYTVLYTSWIYLIFFTIHYIRYKTLF